jgi:hypothetical protein
MSRAEVERLNKDYPRYQQADGIWVRRRHRIEGDNVLIIKQRYTSTFLYLNVQFKLVKLEG